MLGVHLCCLALNNSTLPVSEIECICALGACTYMPAESARGRYICAYVSNQSPFAHQH